MKKFINILFATIFFFSIAGCEGQSQTQTLPTESAPTFSTPSLIDPSVEFNFEVEEEEEEEYYYSVVVYVSRTGKIHRKSNCSGMKYYTPMDYNEAVSRGYSHCQNCY